MPGQLVLTSPTSAIKLALITAGVDGSLRDEALFLVHEVTIHDDVPLVFPRDLITPIPVSSLCTSTELGCSGFTAQRLGQEGLGSGTIISTQK